MRSQGMPEALVGVAFSVHLVFGHGVGAPLSTASRTRAERESDGIQLSSGT